MKREPTIPEDVVRHGTLIKMVDDSNRKYGILYAGKEPGTFRIFWNTGLVDSPYGQDQFRNSIKKTRNVIVLEF